MYGDFLAAKLAYLLFIFDYRLTCQTNSAFLAKWCFNLGLVCTQILPTVLR